MKRSFSSLKAPLLIKLLASLLCGTFWSPSVHIFAFPHVLSNNNGALASKHVLHSFKSQSTASIDPSSNFSQGSQERRERLDIMLEELGVNVTDFLTCRKYSGSAALRTYSSFVLPKSKGALAVAESPTRALVVANNVYFLLQEQEAHEAEWLRNHDDVSRNDEAHQQPREPLYIVLDNVRSAANIGNILRTCEAAHIMQVCLCGSMTPSPPHNRQLLKTAMGAAEYVPFSTYSSTLACIQELKQKGVTVVGVETTSNSTYLYHTNMPQPCAVVFGNELVGIHPQVMKQCDGLVCIPTRGVKNSLNVASCASIVMYEVLRQWNVAAADKMV
jgi:tRNA G18 (ribose-2'-O)-methylase SpoU